MGASASKATPSSSRPTIPRALPDPRRRLAQCLECAGCERLMRLRSGWTSPAARPSPMWPGSPTPCEQTHLRSSCGRRIAARRACRSASACIPGSIARLACGCRPRRKGCGSRGPMCCRLAMACRRRMRVSSSSPRFRSGWIDNCFTRLERRRADPLGRPRCGPAHRVVSAPAVLRAVLSAAQAGVLLRAGDPSDRRIQPARALRARRARGAGARATPVDPRDVSCARVVA